MLYDADVSQDPIGGAALGNIDNLATLILTKAGRDRDLDIHGTYRVNATGKKKKLDLIFVM